VIAKLDGYKDCCCPTCGLESRPDGHKLGGYCIYVCQRCTLRFAPEAFGVPLSYDEVYGHGSYPDQAVEVMRRGEADGMDASRMDTYIPFFRNLHLSKGRNSILDVGCGGGRFCRAAAKRGWKTLGIDVSEVAIQSAREVELLPYGCGALEDAPRLYGKFDVVTSFEVLEHQSDIRRFLEQVLAALKVHGRFFCTVPAWEHPEVRTAVRPDWVPPIHLLFFTRRALRVTLETSGFQVVSTGYIPGPPVQRWPALKWSMKALARRVLYRPQSPLGIWALAKPAG
jgi:SAM-dependent methyltransferase